MNPPYITIGFKIKDGEVDFVKSDVCLSCDSSRTSVRSQEDTFQYGVGEDEAHLTVTIPVHSCETCALQWTDCVADNIKDLAVRNYLKDKK